MSTIDLGDRRFEPGQAHAAQADGALAVVLETHPERAQRAQSTQIVVAVGETAQLTWAVGERRQDQRAVRDASVTRHGYAPLERAVLASNDQASRRHGFCA